MGRLGRRRIQARLIDHGGSKRKFCTLSSPKQVIFSRLGRGVNFVVVLGGIDNSIHTFCDIIPPTF